MDERVERIVSRSVEKTIAGRRWRFYELSIGDEHDLEPAFKSGDARRFVNELIATSVTEPELAPSDIDALTPRSRARARVAVAEVLGIADDYRRIRGAGDDRLVEAMHRRRARLNAQMASFAGTINDNVVRLARDAQQTIAAFAGRDDVARFARDAANVQLQMKEWVQGPAVSQAVSSLARLAEQVRPAFDWVEKNRQLFAQIADTQTRIGESIASAIESLVRPSYFGELEQFRSQFDVVESAQASINAASASRPDLGQALSVRFDPTRLRLANVTEQIRSLARALTPQLQETLALFREWASQLGRVAASAYAAWLERHWPEVYANPDHPAPVLFLIASLPMSIGLPIYQMAVKAKRDERLLEGLERALQTTTLIDQAQQAVQQSSELDLIAKRYLAVALEAMRDGRYIDATPPLYQGLERAFKLVARRRGIIDDRNIFQLPSVKGKAKTTDALFIHLVLDRGYERYLRSYVFGDSGHPVRHGDLPDGAAHRRWALWAFAALLGWFQYCAGDAVPMGALVGRLELTMGEAETA